MEMITREPVRILSMEYRHELDEPMLIGHSSFIKRTPIVPPSPGLTHIPAGESVTVLNYNLNIAGMSDVTVLWCGVKYRVQASKEAFREGKVCYQAVGTFKKGKLYRYQSAFPRPLLNKEKVVGTVRPNDIVLFLDHKPWNNGIDAGYWFQVIHQDCVGWVGYGSWDTLLELREEDQ